MSVYTKLCNDSMEFYEAKKTIDKLTALIEKKDKIILELEKKLNFGHLSPVSLFFSNNSFNRVIIRFHNFRNKTRWCRC